MKYCTFFCVTYYFKKLLQFMVQGLYLTHWQDLYSIKVVRMLRQFKWRNDMEYGRDWDAEAQEAYENELEENGPWEPEEDEQGEEKDN